MFAPPFGGRCLREDNPLNDLADLEQVSDILLVGGAGAKGRGWVCTSLPCLQTISATRVFCDHVSSRER